MMHGVLSVTSVPSFPPPSSLPPPHAVLKAHRLKDTSTFGKQDLYLKLTAGPNQKTSDVHKGVCMRVEVSVLA